MGHLHVGQFLDEAHFDGVDADIVNKLFQCDLF